MPHSDPARASGYRNTARRVSLAAALLLLATGCSADGPSPTAPDDELDPSLHRGAKGARTIVVSNAEELTAALAPQNAGRRIFVRSGTYQVAQLLQVPDGATLEGEGVMRFDRQRRPLAFRPGTRTTIVMTGAMPGDLVTLGDGATLRRITIEDAPGRSGNVVGIVSRGIGDRLSAFISHAELVNPNAHMVAPAGPAGCGITILTLNPALGNAPDPHANASVGARIDNTIVRSPATGVGCGVFAFNFAPSANVSVRMSSNVIGGGLIANGGVSRPDFVSNSTVEIMSRSNVYRDDTPDACVSRQTGWNLQGGSAMPAPIPNAGATNNTLRMHSVNDHLERFTTGVLATGARRFFPAPTSGDVSGNRMYLDMTGTKLSTTACAEAPMSTDLRLAGALVTGDFEPGDGNTLHVRLRGVKGSGERLNVYAHVLGPTGPRASTSTGNILSFKGNAKMFGRVNRNIHSAPASEFFR